ncbi:hypothetical protein MFERI13461_00286 [Mycoplasma feriruminatoris]|uniref:hypothetical protein n=1 Tax=Mycoplasma feriruminatoris TaxID=1179777 RepID=UPI00241F0553|nr:hypothetical protein [Mycoplasma feriruminatoris]WFQ90861.1 hypothetical protein MFERI13461_00286 [Mycoplasma feriruminatoris]
MLEHEDDWSYLYELIEQLEMGYNSALDQIFVIKGKDGYNYVIEGNRRIMIMKFVNNFLLYKPILQKFANVRWYKNVMNKLETFKENETLKEIEVSFIDSNSIMDESEVWKIIYTRHAGENKGKKPWSRLKYFYDLKDIYLNFVNDKKENKVRNIFDRMSEFFNKPVDSVKKDLTSSLWVTDIVNVYNQNCKNDSKISETKNFIHTSSLELCRGAKIFYNYATTSIEKIFNISLNRTQWEVNILKIDKNILYTFLIESVNRKILNTRGWKKETINILYDFLNEHLDGDFSKQKTLASEINEAKKLTKDKISDEQNTFLEFGEISEKIEKTQQKLQKNRTLI